MEEQLITLGRTLELYDESEQADKNTTTEVLDALWQSIYDVYHLVLVGIIEGDIEDQAMVEAKAWLEQAKSHTINYKEYDL